MIPVYAGITDESDADETCQVLYYFGFLAEKSVLRNG